ncbi:MAG: hypothetical protein H7Z74_12345 [Anaerolineae bacterium]|nr:hypothetical protein [Gemmatimonadaceae bacterium]
MVFSIRPLYAVNRSASWVCVKESRAQRYAVESGKYDGFYKAFNDATTAAAADR